MVNISLELLNSIKTKTKVSGYEIMNYNMTGVGSRDGRGLAGASRLGVCGQTHSGKQAHTV